MTLSSPTHEDNYSDFDPAALSDTAYRALLRHELGIRWLDIQLDLWKAMIEKVRQLERIHGRSAAVSKVYPKIDRL